MESFTEEQRAAYKAIQSGKNLFLTGPAGTGKSYLLHHLVSEIKRRIALTAMTGCAALLISTPTHKAKTLHSWAGIGLGKESSVELCKKISASYHAKYRWTTTNMLVIDEISMMTPELLEKLNEIGKKIRKNDKPFGGIQVILVGDFLQLPPVSREVDAKFVFESPQWAEIIQETVHLKTITRQKDPEFQKVLNEARIGKLSTESIDLLKSRVISYDKEEIKPTLLFSLRADVDRVNEQNLRLLTEERQTYEASYSYAPDSSITKMTPAMEEIAKKQDKDAQYVTKLELVVGAQVMLIANMKSKSSNSKDAVEDERDEEKSKMSELVNGSRGIIVRFESGLPVVKFKNGIVKRIGYWSWEIDELKGVHRTQIPLRLAYAVSIHKSQGATLDCAAIDIGSSTFECGQAYVALSRVKSLDSLYIKAFNSKSFKAHQKVIKFYSDISTTSSV